MVKSAGSAVHHAHYLRGANLKLIAVKLAERKLEGVLTVTLGTGRILKESKLACQARNFRQGTRNLFTGTAGPRTQTLNKLNDPAEQGAA